MSFLVGSPLPSLGGRAGYFAALISLPCVPCSGIRVGVEGLGLGSGLGGVGGWAE